MYNKDFFYLCNSWYLGRGVRQRSAKPRTAVQIRQIPHNASPFYKGSFYFIMPEIIVILLMAASLSFDTFAVSIACGSSGENIRLKDALRMALFFTFFQTFMPLIGWAGGKWFETYIRAFDHWIAFILLAFIGGKMMIESFRPPHLKTIHIKRLPVILALSFATTIDALMMGIVFASLHTPLKLALPMIGMITFMAAMTGIFFGKTIGIWLGKKMELAGGIVLMGIGIKILIEHLFLQ